MDARRCLKFMFRLSAKTNVGQLGIDNITWNYDNETDELTPYFGAVITYIDKRMNEREEETIHRWYGVQTNQSY